MSLRPSPLLESFPVEIIHNVIACTKDVPMLAVWTLTSKDLLAVAGRVLYGTVRINRIEPLLRFLWSLRRAKASSWDSPLLPHVRACRYLILYFVPSASDLAWISFKPESSYAPTHLEVTVMAPLKVEGPKSSHDTDWLWTARLLAGTEAAVLHRGQIGDQGFSWTWLRPDLFLKDLAALPIETQDVPPGSGLPSAWQAGQVYDLHYRCGDWPISTWRFFRMPIADAVNNALELGDSSEVAWGQKAKAFVEATDEILRSKDGRHASLRLWDSSKAMERWHKHVLDQIVGYLASGNAITNAIRSR